MKYHLNRRQVPKIPKNIFFCVSKFLSAIAVSLLHINYSEYSLQVLLSAIFISNSFLVLSATLKQVVVATPYCISYFYVPAISATVFKQCYHITLSHNLISYQHQLFFSGAFISYLYLLYLHSLIRYTYQKPFVTNHYQLLLSHTPKQQAFSKISQNRFCEKFCNISRETPTLVSLFHKAQLQETPTLIFSFEYCDIFKNSLFHRTPLPAASTRYPKVPLLFRNGEIIRSACS